MNRRTFLQLTAGTIGGFTMGWDPHAVFAQESGGEPFKISLAQWSLNKSLRAKKFDNLDFARVAKREFEIDCIEFVDQFFADKSKDQKYLAELKRRAEDENVTIGLIMIDTTGDLGTADNARRAEAVDKTLPWIDAVKFLGGHTLRINARGPGNADELRGRMAESATRLADYAAQRNLNVAIENHGGLSSNPQWLKSLFETVQRPNFGALPDFGNFPDEIDRYDAVEMLMPYAKAVSAKASRINAEGEVVETDFYRMMRIVRDGGYSGYVGVESSADRQESEAAYIRATRDVLRKIRAQQKRCQPIFNGRDLSGWKSIHGGTWKTAHGALLGSNGEGWSSNPEKAGSWLHTAKPYADFRLELQFAINAGGNSGVFFRSALEKNPAFTGYELQIQDSAGRPPSKGGAGSLYDVIAPTENAMRPAGQWNSATIIARGQRATVELNGKKIIDTEINRAQRGYIGLQIHDAKSEVQFRNIRLEEL
jgi:L-ribulose-5-phosphate 3-epimerase